MTAHRLNPDDIFPLDAIKGERVEFLSGREDKVRELQKALTSKDASAMVIGDRGIGKTTVAWQLLSAFSDENKRISNERFKEITGAENIQCSFTKASENIKSLADFIFEIIRIDDTKHSFCRNFEYIYDEKSQLNSKFKAQFEVSLPTILKAKFQEETENSGFKKIFLRLEEQQSTDALAERIFNDIVGEIKITYKNDRVIIFIDEADTMPGFKGLGSFIKRVSGVQFVFVGIADTASELIEDHLSAGRKLRAVKIHPLPDREIQEIYDIAEQRSGGQLNVTNGFRSTAIELAGGFPWLAQSFGNAALSEKLFEAASLEDQITLEETDAFEAFSSVLENYKNITGRKINLHALDEKILADVVLFMKDRMDDPTTSEIKSMIGEGNQRNTQSLVTKLVNANIVERMSKNGRYKFSDSITRMFAIAYLKYKDRINEF